MSHELSEKITGLASRINNLAKSQTKVNSRKLLQFRDDLTDLTVLVIKLELDAVDIQYTQALTEINNSIELLNNIDKKIAKISGVISQVKNTVDAVGAVVQQAMKLL